MVGTASERQISRRSGTLWDDKPAIRQVTLRGTIAGLTIGSLVLVSNFRFGLQTGWVSMMSLPSALLACAFFRQVWPVFAPNDRAFTDVETVYIQSMAVAVGTGPLAYGFIGVIPAIELFVTGEESGNTRYFGQSFTFKQLILWSCALAFFGIFFAIPLRKQVIIREKLPFPSGSATAVLIAVLNKSEILQEVSMHELLEMRNRRLDCCAEVLQLDGINDDRDPVRTPILQRDSSYQSLVSQNIDVSADETTTAVPDSYTKNISLLKKTFLWSSGYTLLSYFIPTVVTIPIFGNYLSKTYLWNFQPSPAYVGQGIIMGLPTVSYMLFGTILGWAILAPLARMQKWIDPAADPNDWEAGVQGWILWSSLSIMIADSLVGFLVLSIRTLLNFILADRKSELLNHVWDDTFESLLLEEENILNGLEDNSHRRGYSSSQQTPVKLAPAECDNEVDSKHLVRYTNVISGLILSSLICILLIIYLFGVEIIPVYAMMIALLLALFLSVLGIRGLGETDLNPVSGIGKISQLIFALILPKNHPGAVLFNIVAGGVAEAGAQQAGDMMQDLKTGHLLGASPRAQFVAQIAGASWSIVLSSIMYLCYKRVYDMPSEQFRIPTAAVWVDCARLVTTGHLPNHALECSIVLGCIFSILSLIKNCYSGPEHKWAVWIPSGIAVGVGIYNVPSFTMARFLGGIISHLWLRRNKGDFFMKTSMIVFSSGLVLGEGISSIVNMVFAEFNIPYYA